MRSNLQRMARSAGRDDGFSMVELVGAATILFIILVGIMGAVEYAGAAAQMSSMRQGAIDIAQQEIEFDRNLQWTSIGVTTTGANPSGSIVASKTVTTTQGSYTVSTVIGWTWDTVSIPQKAAYKKITVTVAWTSPQPGSFSIETAVYGTGGTTGLGDVKFTCVDEDTNKPAGQVNVQLQPISGGVQTAPSDSGGIAVFAQMPLGLAKSLSATSVVWLADTWPTVTSIVAGPQDWGKVYCQKPSTADIYVTNSANAPLGGITVQLKDTTRNITYYATTDDGSSNPAMKGHATFDSPAECNNLPGLWKDPYTATAITPNGNSPSKSFTISTGGTAYSGTTLVVPDQPSMLISMVASTTGTPALTGQTWTLTVMDHTGKVIYGPLSKTTNSVQVQVPAADTYTIQVTNAVGFLPATTTFAANATTANQVVNVKMPPLFTVYMRANGVFASVAATITMTGPSTMTSVTPNGQASFVLPAAGTYALSAVVNGVSYTGPTVTLDPANPTLNPTYIDITNGTLSVGDLVPGGQQRIIAVYDSSNKLVAWQWAVNPTGNTAAQTPLVPFSLPGGTYKVMLCGTSITSTPASPYPSGTAGYRASVPASFVLPAGGTYSLTSQVPYN